MSANNEIFQGRYEMGTPMEVADFKSESLTDLH